jgi:PAS domain S-box-containing protein
MRSRAQAPVQFVKSESIAEKYPAATIKNSTDDLAVIMQFVDQLLPDRAIVICQRSNSPSVQYASPNCKSVFGYDEREVMKMSLPDFLTLVHPEDIQEVNQCFAFINASEPYDPLMYRFKMYYRLRHKEGNIINITDEKIAIKSQKGDYVYINSFRDVTSEEKLHDVKMEIYQKVHGDFKRVQSYIPRLNQNNFTPRQIDIVNLISKGFTNQDIARELSVSVNTVKNHKSLLFRKVNVKNSVELLSATRSLMAK